MIRKAQIIDDINRFGPPVVKEEFSQILYGKSDFKMRDPNQLHCTKAQLYSEGGGGCQEYLSFDYTISNEMEVMRRNYKSFTTMMGELGGLLKILTSITFFFYSIYNYKKMRNYMTGVVLNLDENVIKAVKAFKNKKKETINKKNDPAPNSSYSGDSGKKHSSSKSTKIDETSLDQAVKEKVKERMSAEGLTKQLNFLELLESVFFTDYEKRLIPLVLLKLSQKNSKISQNFSDFVNEQNSPSKSQKLGFDSPGSSPTSAGFLSDDEKQNNDKHLKKFYKAFKMMKENRMDSLEPPINSEIQAFIMKSLEGFFKSHSNQENPNLALNPSFLHY